VEQALQQSQHSFIRRWRKVDWFRDTFTIACRKPIAFPENLPYTLNSEELALHGGVIKHSSKNTVVKPYK
jgi:hypothetical protein